MSSNKPDTPSSSSPAGFWSRLWGSSPPEAEAAAPPAAPEADEPLPEFDGIPSPAPSLVVGSTDELPVAEPIQPPAREEAKPCGGCGAPRDLAALHCPECGWLYATEEEVTPSAAAAVGHVFGGRFQVLAPLPARPGLSRYRVRDLQAGVGSPELILLAAVRPPLKEKTEDGAHALDEPPVVGGSTVVMRTELRTETTHWPGLDWEIGLTNLAQEHGLPRLVELGHDPDVDFLVHELSVGVPLWDAWDSRQATLKEKFGWLADLGRTLQAVHQSGAIVEALRPEILRLGLDGKPRFVDLADFLPMPLPVGVQIQASLYSAPELVLYPSKADSRADLFGMGALLYALLLGRELAEMDFERHGVPKSFVERFPDAHPLLVRLMLKTMVRELHHRFPTEDAAIADGTGFAELIETLEHVGAEVSRVRIDVACWTSTGLTRTGNEDACAIFHSAASQQERFADRALVLLTDGMGGCDAGEVASEIALRTLTGELMAQAPFSRLAEPGPAPGSPSPDPSGLELLALLKQAMQKANRAVFEASREPGASRRGMGCTAEVVYVEDASLYVAHVGDSRTYQFSQGELRQLTRDQTLVARLVELGQLSEEEAQYHPRRNELQQALGGSHGVEPLLYHLPVQAGDTILVCSDGLTGMVDHESLTRVLQRDLSAEGLCRRLVNLANARGGSDNTTVVVLRLS